MKKINAKFSQKDRVICVTEQSKHKFYYRQVGSKEKLLLFSVNSSTSILDYFSRKGRMTDNNGYELTIRELYLFRDFHNYKLSKIMERIPGIIEYVIREYIDIEKNNYERKEVNKKKRVCTSPSRYEIAA